MEDIEHSFDELLAHTLLLFRQHQFYDEGQESEEEALWELEKARCVMIDTNDCICMAKWGCTLECLTQKFYINVNIDADDILTRIDANLVSFCKKKETYDVRSFMDYLWLGYYFLLRFRSREAHSPKRSKQVISDLLSFLIDVFRRFKDNSALPHLLSLFSPEVWGETVYWAEMVHNTHINEKRSAKLLHLLYDVRPKQLPKENSGQDVLLQRILEYYCF